MREKNGAHHHMIGGGSCVTQQKTYWNKPVDAWEAEERGKRKSVYVGEGLTL